MKNFNNILLLIVLIVSAAACKNSAEPEVKSVAVDGVDLVIATSADPDAKYAKVKFNIDGMTCAMGCAKTIEKKMAKMDGVKSAKVDFDNELAMVEYDEAKVSPESLEGVVTKVGGGDVYIVKNMAKVESFDDKAPCPEDCNKACCANKTTTEKMACAKDCDKACCKQKA